MNLKVSMSLGSNAFLVDGDVSFADAVELAKLWLANQQAVLQAEIDGVTKQLRKDNDSLSGSVDSHTPAS